ncbi:MAG TPA: trypsin-like peptidase domain-containing protein [Flavitalea sp.]|nr:trypsin-like peptidase domain-containing protein [Flavitalea sp.]
MVNAIKWLLVICPLSVYGQLRETWISRPKNEWPQISLTNHVRYRNGESYIHPSFPYAGTGFLINTGTDTIAATAKHVLLIARNRKTNAVTINNDLLLWSMKSKQHNSDSVIINKLINDDTAEVIEGPTSSIFERDMLVFSIKKASPKIYPLKPRFSTPKMGEKVYLLACPYSNGQCTVNEGTIIGKYGFDIIINTNDPVLPGASGAPVIDANGYLIGIFSSLTNDNSVNKDVSVAISTEYLKDVLAKKPKLNEPKKDYTEMIVNTTLYSGPEAAINEYKRLTAYPQTYYFYNFRSATRNGLREAGEKLLSLDQVDEAIEILKFNTEVNSNYYGNYNILAKAYMRAGNKAEAIRAYTISTSKNNDASVNEAFGELEKLK